MAFNGGPRPGLIELAEFCGFLRGRARKKGAADLTTAPNELPVYLET